MLFEKLFSFGGNKSTLSQAPTTSRKSIMESLECRRLMYGGINASEIIAIPFVTNTSVQGYTPSQIRVAYGITGTGAGQTIAIVDAYGDPSIRSDLAAFNKQMGLASAKLSIVNQSGSASSLPAADSGWSLETSLDVEWAHATAPAAKILLVETSSSSLSDLLAGVNTARYTGASVVSMSWGSSEFSSETYYDSYFTTPAGHANVTFVASSGDSGLVEWPSTSQNVLSVGGTTLIASPTGAYLSESGWADSGGGFSRFEAEPSYQRTVQSTGVRTTPDVAFSASPSEGFAVYDSIAYQGQSGWFEVGGTSAGAPQWASLIAIADQTRAAKGLGALSTSTVQSSLYGTVTNASTYVNDFQDITTGMSFDSGWKNAFVGYDLVTGLGSPKAAGVVATLANASSSTGTSASATLALVGKKSVSTAAVVVNSSTSSMRVPSLDSTLPENPGIIASSSTHGSEIDVTPVADSDAPSVLESFRSPGLMLALDHLHVCLEMSSQAINAAISPGLFSEIGEAAISSASMRLNDIVQSFGFSEAVASFSQLTAELPSAFENEIFNDFMSIGTTAKAFVADSPLVSLLSDESVAQTWEVAAAACMAGAVAAWWWTDEGRADRSGGEPSLFSNCLIEVVPMR